MNRSEQKSLSPSGPAIEGIINAALEISEKRAQITQRMKKALLHDDVESVLKFARELCGIIEDAGTAVATKHADAGKVA